MLNKKGFTLIELLAVIVIIAIVSSIASVGIVAIRNSINESLLDSKFDIIESGAVLWGQDNMILLSASDDTCSYTDEDGNVNTYSNCISKTIRQLGSYIEGGSTCVVTDSSGKSSEESCLTNDVTGESMNDDTVFIYLSNNRVYAKYPETQDFS